jgi:hypothetical protein
MLALLQQLLVLSEIAFALLEISLQFIIHAHLGSDIGGNQILSVYDLAQTSGTQVMWWVGACWSLIEPLRRGWYSDSTSSSSLDGNQFA